MKPEYNAAQRILINIGGTAAMAVAMGDLNVKAEKPVKRVRKISYGASLKAHFDSAAYQAKRRTA